jgi:hypothetical protein
MNLSIPLIKEIKINEECYMLKLENKKESIQITLNDNLSKKQWMKYCFFPKLVQENENWLYFVSKDKLFYYLQNILDDNCFKIYSEGEEFILTFDHFIKCGSKEEKISFSLILSIPNSDSPLENGSSLFEYIRKIDNITYLKQQELEQKIEELKIKLESEKIQILDSVNILAQKMKMYDIKIDNVSVHLERIENVESKIDRLTREMMSSFSKKEELSKLEEKIEKLSNQNKQLIKEYGKYVNIKKINKEQEEEEENEMIREAIKKSLIINSERTFINTNSKLLKFTDMCKTIEVLGGLSYKGVLIDEVIPNKGKFSYSVKIVNSKTFNILLGFGLKTEEGEEGYFYENCFMFALDNGNLFNKGVKKFNETPKVRNGSVLTVEIDMNNWTTSLYNEGQIVGQPQKFEYDKKDIFMNDLCPCVDLYSKGDIITLLTS